MLFYSKIHNTKIVFKKKAEISSNNTQSYKIKT